MNKSKDFEELSFSEKCGLMLVADYLSGRISYREAMNLMGEYDE